VRAERPGIPSENPVDITGLSLIVLASEGKTEQILFQACIGARSRAVGPATSGISLDWPGPGASGAAPGKFNEPHGIAMGSAGRIFVADRLNERVQEALRLPGRQFDH